MKQEPSEIIEILAQELAEKDERSWFYDADQEHYRIQAIMKFLDKKL